MSIDVQARPFAAVHEAIWLHINGQHDEAETILRGVEREPAASIARRQLIMLLHEQGRWTEAVAVLEKHAAAHPENPQISYYLGTNLLGLGEYERGFELYELRRRLPGFVAVRPPATREWTGEPVASLLLLDEQGYGDVIQFARYIPRLQAQGTQVTVVCRPELGELLGCLGVTIAPPNGPVPNCEAWSYFGSLPLRLGERLETLVGNPYLRADINLVDIWRTRLPLTARIGVATRGRATHPNNANRSLPAVEAAYVQSFQGAVSLDVEDNLLGIRHFADTAAIISNLDMVIAVDTSIAHLAGALGKRCLILLPFDCDWRWLHGCTDSPWYKSTELLRQDYSGNWLSAISVLSNIIGRDGGH